jgi:orotate phosphoribosyltransferase
MLIRGKEMTTRELLRSMLVDHALILGPITLSNGKQADYYFDCKRVTLSSQGASLVANVFLDVLGTFGRPPDAIGGLTHGADPIVSAVMMRGLERGNRYEAFSVRKEPKKHGTKQWIENPPPPRSKVVIIDDVVTTGGSVIQALDRAEEAGCEVVGVICLVDREEGGKEAIEKRSSNYIAIYNLSDFPEVSPSRLLTA